MKEQLSARFLLATPECASEKVQHVLSSLGFAPDAVCLTGEEAVAAAQGAHVLLLTAWKLSDMSGVELAARLGEDADVLMIVPQDYEEGGEGDNVLLLRNPLSPDALYQSIRTTMHMQKALLHHKSKAKRLERTLEDRKVVDKAKGRLMNLLHMSEPQAHHFIQKKSMDCGKRIVDIAAEVLAVEDLAAYAQVEEK